MSDYVICNDELYHHGVIGMKWGVRRYQNKDGSLTAAGKKRQAMLDAKDAKSAARVNKQAKKAAFDKVYSQSTRTQNVLTKSRRKAYSEALNKTAEESRIADKAYKQSKKDYRKAKSDYREQKTIDTYKKHGLDYTTDNIANVKTYGLNGAKRIENRIANKNMSRLKAETIEQGRSAVTTALAVAGTLTVAAVASTVAKGPTYQVLDATGKVVRNFYR